MFSENLRDATVIHIPHTGTLIPSLEGFVVPLARVEMEVYRLTDHDTDKLFEVPGITRIICPWSRVFCDVERYFANDEMESQGMGFYYTTCDDGTPMRTDDERIKHLVADYYHAHHRLLNETIDAKIAKEGICYLIDAHSFSEVPFKRDLDQKMPRPDICIGTTDTNTPEYLIDAWELQFKKAGLTVDRNTPYKGSLIPKHLVGDSRFCSIMIEVNRKLYGYGSLELGTVALNNMITEVLTYRGL